MTRSFLRSIVASAAAVTLIGVVPAGIATAAVQGRSQQLTARLSGPAVSSPGRSVGFFTAKTVVPVKDKIVGWSINYGDGSRKTVKKGAQPRVISHTFSRIGRYPVTLTLTDAHRRVSSARATVTVRSSAAARPVVGPPSASVAASPIAAFPAATVAASSPSPLAPPPSMQPTPVTPTPTPVAPTPVTPTPVTPSPTPMSTPVATNPPPMGAPPPSPPPSPSPAPTSASPSPSTSAAPPTNGVAGALSLVAGRNRTSINGPATATPLGATAVAVDGTGTIYVADATNHEVERVAPDGTLTIVAGTGLAGEPTTGPALSSALNFPDALAVDSNGDIYVADMASHVVAEIAPDNTLTVVAGTGQAGQPTPGPATSSQLKGPDGLAIGSGGNVYIADGNAHEVLALAPGGALSIVAGTGQEDRPTAGPARSSALGMPIGLAIDNSGAVYIADFVNNGVERIDPDGTLSVVAGNGGPGSPTAGPATSTSIGYPTGVAVDGSGAVYISDLNGYVEKVSSTGTLSVIAGQYQQGRPSPGRAVGNELGYLEGIAVDTQGAVYIADGLNEVIERVTSDGMLSFAAGTTPSGVPTPGPAISSKLDTPGGVATDGDGNVYVADTNNSDIEKITPGGALTVVVGTGQQGAPTAGPATRSNLDHPSGVAVDSGGNLYVADRGNHEVEKITPDGVLTIVAGTGIAGRPTEGPATTSKLDYLNGVAVDNSGNLYIADSYLSGNFDDFSAVEKVSAGGILSIVAGTSSVGQPTPGPANRSELNYPSGVAVDGNGDLYIADDGNEVVEKVTPDGTLSIVAGIIEHSGPPTPGPATSSLLRSPTGVAADAQGNIYIADAFNFEVDEVSAGGTLSVLAGTGTEGAPTPGPAASSNLDRPNGVAVDSHGNVYVADTQNSDVERINAG